MIGGDEERLALAEAAMAGEEVEACAGDLEMPRAAVKNMNVRGGEDTNYPHIINETI